MTILTIYLIVTAFFMGDDFRKSLQRNASRTDMILSMVMVLVWPLILVILVITNILIHMDNGKDE